MPDGSPSPITEPSASAPSTAAPRRAVRLLVNGAPYELDLDPRRTLLDALREDIGLTGAKPGCRMGNCGACTVLMEDEAVYSCLLLAVECEGRAITTIEGLAQGDELDPVQAAFVQHDALQCGFCTPGQVLAMKALLKRNPHPTDEEIERGMSGNLCRCGAYPKILAAARALAGRES
jgi:aerobic-type carbon monoxide dehydrogenase small subunit (CoxS/CutS family)